MTVNRVNNGANNLSASLGLAKTTSLTESFFTVYALLQIASQIPLDPVYSPYFIPLTTQLNLAQ